jgi:hypothetical protein
MTAKWEPFQDVSLGGWWQAFQAAVPWAPPQSLELRLLKIHDDRPWLNEAVDIMAFGAEKVSDNPFEVAARRAQASRALCQAARDGTVQMLGSAKRSSDANDPIPPAYFDIPRQLGADANSLDVFSDQISDEAFFSISAGDGYERWFNVRIKKQSFLNWLERVLQAYFRYSDWKGPPPTLAQKGDIPTRQLKRGPKFKFDWKEGREYFDGLMSTNGELDDRQEWSAQADIERLVLKHMGKYAGGEPSPSLVQKHVSEWLADFRASQPAQ